MSARTGWGADAPLLHKRLRLGERTLEFLSGSFDPPRSVLGRPPRTCEPPGEETLLLDEPALVERAARALALRPAGRAARRAGVGRKSVAYAARAGSAVACSSSISLASASTLQVLAGTLLTLFREATCRGRARARSCGRVCRSRGHAGLWPLLTERIARRLQIAIVCEHNPPWLARVRAC